MTHAVPITLINDNVQLVVEVPGVVIPTGKRFMLGAHSVDVDLAYVPDFDMIQPKR